MVLPLVPVTPASTSFSAGSPARRAAARSASARARERDVDPGRGDAGRRGRSQTTAAAPRASASGTCARPSESAAADRDEEIARPHLPGVAGRRAGPRVRRRAGRCRRRAAPTARSTSFTEPGGRCRLLGAVPAAGAGAARFGERRACARARPRRARRPAGPARRRIRSPRGGRGTPARANSASAWRAERPQASGCAPRLRRRQALAPCGRASATRRRAAHGAGTTPREGHGRLGQDAGGTPLLSRRDAQDPEGLRDDAREHRRGDFAGVVLALRLLEHDDRRRCAVLAPARSRRSSGRGCPGW